MSPATTNPAPLHDYSRSRAVLIGAWDYIELPSVGAATRNSLMRMERLLTGPLCGWPTEDTADRLTIVRNPLRRGDLPNDLVGWFEGITDVALFYFVGHGQLHGDELCLALTESPKNGPHRLTRGLRFSDVREALHECDAKTKIVILDCCFSGIATLREHALAAPATAADEVDVIAQASGTGAFTMAASGAYRTAWRQSDKDAEVPQTFFTKYLIDTVEQGLPGSPEGLSLRAIFDQTADALAGKRLPAPTRSVRHDADRFILARNTPATGGQKAPVKPSKNPLLTRRRALALGVSTAAIAAGGSTWWALDPHDSAMVGRSGTASHGQPDLVYVPDYSGRLTALNAADGSVAWTFRNGEGARSWQGQPWTLDGQGSPVLLYSADTKGNTFIYLINTETGNQVWKYRIATQRAAVSVWGESVYFITGGTDGNTYSITAAPKADAGLGLVDWIYRTPFRDNVSVAGGNGSVNPSIVYIAGYDAAGPGAPGQILALSVKYAEYPSLGKVTPKWTYETPGGFGDIGDVIIGQYGNSVSILTTVSSSEAFCAVRLDGTSGAVQWTSSPFTGTVSSFQLPSGNQFHSLVYAGIDSTSGDGTLTAAITALDLDTGKARWTYEITDESAPQGVGAYDFIVSNDVIYALVTAYPNNGPAWAGSLLAINALTGKRLWNSSLSLGSEPHSIGYPGADIICVLADGPVVQGSPSYEIVGINVSSGSRVWSFNDTIDTLTISLVSGLAGETTPEDLILYEEGALATPPHHAVACLDTTTGKLKWRTMMPAETLGGIQWASPPA